MSEENEQDATSGRTAVHQVLAVDDVAVRRAAKYRVTDDGTLTVDVYYPPGSRSEWRMPVVVFVLRYPDSTMEAMFGCKPKDVGQYIPWGG
jgi:hypothetical protein